MVNIRLVSIDITGIPEFNSLSRSYINALANKNKVAADRIQRYLEQKTSRLLKANLVQGKLGQSQVTDFILSPSSPVLELFKQEVTESSDIRSVEFKALAGAYKGTKIGQITLGTGTAKRESIYKVEGQEDILGAELPQKLLGVNKTGYIVDLDPFFTDQRNGQAKNRSTKAVTNRVFNYYMSKEPRLRQLFYSKASTMILNNVYSLDANGAKTSGTRLIGLQFPLSQFNAGNFKATIEDNAIIISINDSFQKQIFNALDKDYLKFLETTTSEVVKVKIASKTRALTIDMLPVLKGSQVFGAEITKSIKVRPSDTFIVKATNLTSTEKQSSKQAFISGVQWTVLTQRRLGQTMLRIGEPEPPELKERSGRFRGSVRVFANYRTRTLQYLYNPLYASLKDYGYRPDLQVETAIREVAQSLYAQKFNIVRGNTSL
jgi:hypothetical protein